MVDFQLPFIRALLLLGNTASVNIKVKEKAGYQVSATYKGNVLDVTISDAYNSAPQEVLDGMAFSIIFRMFKRKPSLVVQKEIDTYKEFMTRESVAKHNEALRKERGKKRKIVQGSFYNLDEILRELSIKYWDTFEPIGALPEISYSAAASKRRLGYYDSAHHMIFISSIFDDARVPKYAIENVIFHELLHAKHDVKYQRGESLRRTVHTQEFKKDERKYEHHYQAEEWIKKEMRKLR